MIDDVLRAHQHIALPDGNHTSNTRYETPAVFVNQLGTPTPDPCHTEPAHLKLIDPTSSSARRAIATLAAAHTFDPATSDKLALAVSELATNANTHGRPPVHLYAWAQPQRVVVTVSDHGPGPDNLLTGLMPADRDVGAGGYGLWVAHQSCSELVMYRHVDGFTVRIIGQALT